MQLFHWVISSATLAESSCLISWFPSHRKRWKEEVMCPINRNHTDLTDRFSKSSDWLIRDRRLWYHYEIKKMFNFYHFLYTSGHKNCVSLPMGKWRKEDLKKTVSILKIVRYFCLLFSLIQLSIKCIKTGYLYSQMSLLTFLIVKKCPTKEASLLDR